MMTMVSMSSPTKFRTSLMWHESSHLCPLLPPFVLLPLLLRVIRERDLGKKGEKGVEEA